MKIKMIKPKQAFTGKENHNITLAGLNSLTANYRKDAPIGNTLGGFLAKADAEALINQPKAVGMRYYYGKTEAGKKVLVWAGTKANMNDILDDAPVKLGLIEIPLNNGTVQYNASDYKISASDAGKLTARHRESLPKDAIKGGFFGAEAIRRILDQEDCVGIRFYFGQEDDGKPVMTLLAVTHQGSELFDGFLAEFSQACPPKCAMDNILNSTITIAEPEEMVLQR